MKDLTPQNSLSDVSFGDPTLGDQLDVSGWGSLYEHSSYSSNQGHVKVTK